MSNEVKDVDLKNQTYYFFNDMINIRKSDANNTKIDEHSYKKYSYLLYWICDNQRFEIRKSLYCKFFILFFFKKGNGYFEETNGKKILM